jgi:methylmalonyl-CoA/ethylmalonyl-CoA epimerase
MRRIHHVGVVVRQIADAYRFYRDVLELPLLEERTIADQGVRAALLAAGDTEIELLEPLSPSSGVGRFLARHGEGLHHLCFETADIAASLADLRAKNADLIDEAPREGLAGQIAFLHPRTCAGVLVELAMPPASETASGHAPRCV